LSQPTPDRAGPAGPRSSPDLGLDRSDGRHVGVVRRAMARIAWPVLREQIAFNHRLADDVRAIGVTLGDQHADCVARDAGPALAGLRAEVAAVSARVDEIAGRVERQGWAIEAAVPKLESHGYALEALAPRVEHQGGELDAVRSAVADLEEAARDLRATIEHQGWAIEAAVPKLESHGYTLATLEEAIEALRAELEVVDRQSFARYHDGIGSIRSAIGDLAARVEVEADDVAARIEAERAAGEKLATRLRATEQAFQRELAAARIRLAQVDLVLAGIRVAVPNAEPEPHARRRSDPSGAVEQLWAAYADALGEPTTRAEARATTYLADILATRSAKPVLDIGAGRGEWLEWLRKAGLDAYGVEAGSSWGSHAAAGGATSADVVAVDDVVEHLRGIGKSSLAAITAARVVGYLTAGELVDLLDLAALAIEPGGVLVIDMSDPVGIAAGTEPTIAVTSSDRHVGSAFLAFALAARGFVEVELRRLASPGGAALVAAGASALVARRP